MRRILVPVKRVPDYEAKIRVLDDGTGIVTDGVKWIVNPFDEIAVEEAVRIKEVRSDLDEVVVVSVGPEAAVEQLRAMMAIGADRGIHVVVEKGLDSFAVHEILVKVYEKETPAMVLMGKQAIDSDASQTAQLLAASLGLPQATFASKIEISEAFESAEVTREIDGGLETIRVTLPAVISTDLRLNEPRYASLKGIMQAKKKTLETLSLQQLGIEPELRVKIRSMKEAPARQAGVRVRDVAELLEKLRNEAKVL